MGYSPLLGQWLQPDPAGDLRMSPKIQRATIKTGMPEDDSLDATARVKATTVEKLGRSHEDDWWLWAYADGSNLYEFVKSNPVNATDPTGTDRYVGSYARLHYWLGVDTWGVQNGKWVKTGVLKYEFRLKYKCWYAPINAVGSFLLSAQGEVERTSGLKGGTTHYQIQSSAQEDIKLIAELDGQLVNPPNYHVFFFNCNYWVESFKYFGIPGLRQGIQVGPPIGIMKDP